MPASGRMKALQVLLGVVFCALPLGFNAAALAINWDAWDTPQRTADLSKWIGLYDNVLIAALVSDSLMLIAAVCNPFVDFFSWESALKTPVGFFIVLSWTLIQLNQVVFGHFLWKNASASLKTPAAVAGSICLGVVCTVAGFGIFERFAPRHRHDRYDAI